MEPPVFDPSVDRLTELMAKLDKMRDTQVALQDRLSSARRIKASIDTAIASDTGGSGEGQGDENRASGNSGAGVVDPVAAQDLHDSSDSSQRLSAEGEETSATSFSSYGGKRETFMVAAEKGDLKTLKALISDWDDDTILMNESLYLTASKGHLACTILLAQHNADCKYWHSPEDETVLSVSAAKGNVIIMEFLLGQGVNVNQQASGDKHTALHAAATHGQKGTAGFLIDSGCDLDSKDTFGITPLMAACKNGHVEIVTQLLDAKADPSLKSRVKKETAFVIAFENDQAACLQELMIYCPDEAKKELKGGLLPLHHAIRHGKDEIVIAMIDAGADLNLADGPWTPIHLAVEMSNIPIIGILAACGADLNAHLPVPKKVTVLMLAVCKENDEMVRAIGSQAACNLNQFDELGRTALYLAAKFGYVKCVEVLLEICADQDAYAAHMVQERSEGDGTSSLPAPTALHAAILNDHPEVAKLLIAGGCKTDMGAIFEEDGVTNVFTPLHIACIKNTKWAIDMLLEGGTTVPDGFIDWCKRHGLDAAVISHVENAVATQKKNPDMLKKS